jgi:DNA-binding CsgD family transcriptional regulator
MWLLLHILRDERADPASRFERARRSCALYRQDTGSARAAEAVLLARAGRCAEADGAFDEARDLLAPAPWHLHVSTRLVAEDALRHNWQAPLHRLPEAMEFFDRHGMARPADASRRLLRRAGLHQRRSVADDLPQALQRAGLTAREIDVLRLLVTGLSNREIAAQLYLSPRTVEKHVEHLMTKTAAHGRAQLAAYAVAAGIRRQGYVADMREDT